MQKTVLFIEGDGIGAEVTKAAQPIINKAVEKAYGTERSLVWKELLAGEKAFKETGEYLPQSTLDALSKAELAMKGPLTTPVGKGFRSLNVTMRQVLDLYACIRPIKYFDGIMSPVLKAHTGRGVYVHAKLITEKLDDAGRLVRAGGIFDTGVHVFGVFAEYDHVPQIGALYR